MTEAFRSTACAPHRRYGGALAAVRPTTSAAHVLRALVDRLPTVDWSAVDDVVLGCANQAGEDNRNVARMALLLAGLPETVSGTTVNRLCGSGADAVAMAAARCVPARRTWWWPGRREHEPGAVRREQVDRAVRTRRGDARHDAGLAVRQPGDGAPVRHRLDGRDRENVAAERGVSRADQDAFALRRRSGPRRRRRPVGSAEEIVPVTVPARRGEGTVVDTDEHPRATTLESWAAARGVPRRRQRHGGQLLRCVNDGAAALLVASERAVRALRPHPARPGHRRRHRGVAPRVMGLGPVPATRRLLERPARVADLDVVELNEAFAAQALAVLRDLGLPDDAEHVNPNGGAIALGTPSA
jgi:acetyl-CoA acetyltransferase family protein